ncbi:hypothetical protein FS373_15325 [Shewanella sp. YLB-07]|nr:hypothetical protein [Shewanella sp. YLB-07]
MQLPKGLHSAVIAGAAVYLVHQLTKGLGRLDETANILTKPVGQAWSDVSAWAGGWQAVELTALIIQPWYLDSNFQISSEAWRVLTVDEKNRALMHQLFDNRTLKQEYRHLVGQPIEGL